MESIVLRGRTRAYVSEETLEAMTCSEDPAPGGSRGKVWAPSFGGNPKRMRLKKTFYAVVGFVAVKIGSRVARRRLRKALHRA
jgi:hypothetical protein